MVEERQTGATQPRLRPYAWLLAGVGGTLLVGSGLVYLLNRAWVFEAQLGAGLGLILLLAAILLQPHAVHAALTGRSARYGSNALVTSLAFISILALLNFLSYKYNLDYDLTETNDFTLSAQTIQVLKNLSQPVQIIGLFQASDPRLTLAKNYLKRYAYKTSYLSYEFHDPAIEPALVQNFELNTYGLVFVSGDKQYQTTSVDEQTLTSGLIRVTGDSARVIYFVTGHGERSLDDSTPEGYSAVKESLERENYTVNTLALTSTIPTDAAVLILAGAERDLFDSERQLLQSWLDGGGKLLLLADPLQPAPLASSLARYGLTFSNDFAVDMTHSAVALGPEGLTQQLTTPMLSQYPFHEITRNLNGYQAFFPFARSLAITPTSNLTRQVMPLLSTSADSWAETDLTATQLEFNEGADWVGPLNLGAAVEDSESGLRLVAIGNSSFAANQNISPQSANLDLFMNAVNWLAEEDELISIRPKPAPDRRVFLTPLQTNLTLLTTLIVLPLAVLAGGIIVWWKRR